VIRGFFSKRATPQFSIIGSHTFFAGTTPSVQIRMLTLSTCRPSTSRPMLTGTRERGVVSEGARGTPRGTPGRVVVCTEIVPLIERNRRSTDFDTDPFSAGDFLRCIISATTTTRSFSGVVAMHQSSTILVIEDDLATREFVAEVCREEGYQVVTVGDTRRANAILTECTPDLIICDYRLPGPTGLAFASAMRGAGSTTPIILMTADTNTVRSIDLADVCDCLYKPFSLDGLLACVARHLPAIAV
jgi:CheY-like chemotaxis protein